MFMMISMFFYLSCQDPFGPNMSTAKHKRKRNRKRSNKNAISTPPTPRPQGVFGKTGSLNSSGIDDFQTYTKFVNTAQVWIKNNILNTLKNINSRLSYINLFDWHH